MRHSGDAKHNEGLPVLLEEPDPQDDSKSVQGRRNKKHSSLTPVRDELDAALSDNNEEDCHFCKLPGKLSCCDYCFRSYHPECSEEGKHTGKTWKCPVCLEKELPLCRNSKRSLVDIQNQIVLQCTLCGGK